MLYEISCVKSQNKPFSPLEQNEVTEFRTTIEESTRFNAYDEFLHTLFIDAKKNGFKIHHRSDDEIAFIAKFYVYGSDEEFIKYVCFSNFKVKEIKEDESTQI